VVRVRITVDVRTAKRLKLPVTLARASVDVVSQRRDVTVRIGRAAAHVLRHARSISLHVATSP
jgi:hypothetical protein